MSILTALDEALHAVPRIAAALEQLADELALSRIERRDEAVTEIKPPDKTADWPLYQPPEEEEK